MKLIRHLWIALPARHLASRGADGDRYLIDFVTLLFSTIFVLSVCGYYIAGAYMGKPYPYDTFLLNPANRFGDFFEMVRLTREWNPYLGEARSAYPPFANLFMGVWSMLPGSWSLVAFNVIAGIGFFALIRALAKPASIMAISGLFLALYVSSYPVLFCIDRGNSEIYVGLLVGVFLLFYDSANREGRWVAVTALALAISLKIVPVVFCFLYFKDRRWRELGGVFWTALLVSLGSLFVFQGAPALNAKAFIESISGAQNVASSDLLYAGFSVSLFNALRLLGMWSHHRELVAAATDYYVAIVGFIILIVTVRLWFGKFVMWESAVCMAALGCLLPSISGDYKLCVLLTAALFVILDGAATRRGYRIVVLALIAFACAPKNWIILLPGEIRGDIGLGSILTPFALCGLIGVIVGTSARVRLEAPTVELAARSYDTVRLMVARHRQGFTGAVIVVMLVALLVGCWISLNSPSVEMVGAVRLDAPVHYRYPEKQPLVCIPPASGSGRVQLMTLDTSFSITPRADVQLENLFGTAEGTDGLRLEYSNSQQGHNGTLVFVHGLPLGGLQVHHLSRIIQAGRTYTCRIVLTDTKDLEVYLDSKKVSLVRPRPDAVLFFDGLRLGSKYNGSQPFTGGILLDTLTGTVGRPKMQNEGWKWQQAILGGSMALCGLSVVLLRWIFANRLT